MFFRQSNPQLLVSVRNLKEARIARTAGVDLIDLKEPHLGSLGMVEAEIAEQVASAMPQSDLSLALGELTEWSRAENIPQIPSAFRFLKLGLSKQASHRDWLAAWLKFRQLVEERSAKPFQWIAVVYADYATAQSPAPEEIIQAARDSDSAGVLFDTWSKTGESLTDHLSIEQLNSYIEELHTQGLLAALAGSLREEHLSSLLPLGADVIAVRGAVCSGGDRTAGVSAEAIVNFRRSLGRPALSAGR